MKLDEFENNLAVYSSDLYKWPDELRKAAEGLLIKSVKAQDLFSEATNLDMLINPDVTQPPDDLMEKIADKVKNK